MNVDNTEEFRCISLCSGYAGIELGLKRVIPNMRTVAYVEVEAFAAANLVAKIEVGKLDAAPIWTDIKTFNGQLFRDRIHIITGGYPCQPFSVAGQRKGHKDPRHLWPYIERIIQAVRPVWCFFENVSGHLTIGYPSVYRSLRLMGYSVEAGLFTAAECDAPHRRERLFILAQSETAEWGWLSEKYSRWRIEKTGRPNGSQLGNTRSPEPRGISSCQQQKDTTIRQTSWPARPKQPQYEWEKSRTIPYTSDRDNGSTNQQGIRRYTVGGCDGQKGLSKETEIESRLGRTVDGASSRVDRLRLLGNGVVPQCAEKAFRTLMELFNPENK